MERCVRKTVYILGAGFSAPAGIPTMADFISKAKDINDDDIKELLEKIRNFFAIKNYCKSDLRNLEEVFSILEADDLISGSKNVELMKSFIEKTVEFYTPKMDTLDENLYSSKDNWVNYIINGKYEKIFHFLSRVMLLKFKKEGEGEKYPKIEKMDWKEHNDIITFNYDKLLENCIESLKSRTLESSEVSLEPILDKLHGSVGCKNIVPPTWAKMRTEKLEEVWRSAFEKISDADRLVFIGYSLPESDAYFRYFLKAALGKAKKLEEIKVVCKDEKGIVEKNYEEFFSPVEFKFINKRWEEIVPGFDRRSLNDQSSDNPPVKKSGWIEENDPENIFGWGVDTWKEQTSVAQGRP